MIILNIILSVIKNVLTAIYQYFWVSVLISVTLTVCYLFVYEEHPSGQGLKKAIRLWFRSIKSSSEFRILFLLCIYGSMIFFRTVLNRNLWLNPLSNVFGDWGIYQTDSGGTQILKTDCIENIVLFIPFSFLSFWFLTRKQKIESISRLLFKNIRYAFFLTMLIEFSQLFLRVGTFQISDIVYNFSGGLIGSLIFLIAYQIYHHYKK